ncbi:polycystin-1 [Pholidichthys leucotaenia]
MSNNEGLEALRRLPAKDREGWSRSAWTGSYTMEANRRRGVGVKATDCSFKMRWKGDQKVTLKSSQHRQELEKNPQIQSVHQEEMISCPKGSRIHLNTLRCYWLSEMTSSWFEAQDSCRETWGGDLASAEIPEVQNFILYTFPAKTAVWVWIWGSGGEGTDQDQKTPVQWDRGVCAQMALGTMASWRKALCTERHKFICEKEVAETSSPMDGYLTGLVLLTGVYADTQVQPLPSIPDIGQQTVEVQLFPGMWFSHAGQLVSAELVVQPRPVPTLARVQILRPYCRPNHHLVPPGCISLLNPFSCCSPVPLCNTTGGCSMGWYWCHLLEACVSTNSPCSAYDSAVADRGFALPPRYSALSPFYHLVADVPLKINPSSELETIQVHLQDRFIMVYPDDVVALQHTLPSGAFLHCLSGEAFKNSPWHQSYLSFRGMEWGGWWEGGLISLPKGSMWVDGVVCDLRMLYLDTLHKATDILDYTPAGTTTATNISPNPDPSLGSKFRLHIIHPIPDERNQIHIEIDTPCLFVLNARFGEGASSSWSAPVLRNEVPFYPSCPEEQAQSLPACRKETQNTWFSSVMVLLKSQGVHVLNISMTDSESFQTVSVKVCGYEAVRGLDVKAHGCSRMLINTAESFTAMVKSGSSVKFTWVIDDRKDFAHEGETYSVTFKKPAEYKLLVTASNPVSSESQQLHLTADEMTPLAEPEFLFVKEVVAVGAAHPYTMRVKADVAVPLTFRWDFGDGTESIVHTWSAPCQTPEWHEAKEKQVYVQDSVNFTYSIPGSYTLHVRVFNQYDNTNSSMTINVRPQLKSLLITPSPPVGIVNQTVYLEASTEPSTLAVFYMWDFADDSKGVQGFQGKIRHTFASAGSYNITVCANNTVTTLTVWLNLHVFEEVSAIALTHSGPSEVGTTVNFKAEVVTGSDLIFDFDFGDGAEQKSLQSGSVSHIYTFPGSYTVDVTVSNSVSQAQQFTTVEVYNLTISGLLPTECIMSGKNTQFTALVNGNISILTFHWLFGDGSPSTVVTGQSTAIHTFLNHGMFEVNLTVFSSVTSASFRARICVESPIAKAVVQLSKDVVEVGEEVCVRVLVSPEQRTGYQLRWFCKPSDLAVVTETSQHCFIFRDEGIKEVLVLASNRVSNKTTKAHIAIQKPVSNLHVAHGIQNGTVAVNALVWFWIASCAGSNVSVRWDFGDGSSGKHAPNVSHVFTSAGQFTVTTMAFNAVSQESASLTVNVLPRVSDLSLHKTKPYAEVGKETLITAVSSTISSTRSVYYWTVEGISSSKRGTDQFRFVFPKLGVYKVTAMAHNLISKREATILIDVFERIDGLQIGCQSLTKKKYIPAHEEIIFFASFTKGSNITFNWLAIQNGGSHQTVSNEQRFYVLVESPGNISVQLKAFNVLGEATSNASIVAVERVEGAHIAAQSYIVSIGKLVNISTFVETGSDLQYLWYVNTDVSPLDTHLPFLLHTFSSLGYHLVTVSVQNVISQSNDTQRFLVQEEIQHVEFKINDRMHPFYVSSSAVLAFNGFTRRGSDLHWDWTVRTADQNLFTSTSRTFTYSFPQAGIYQVYLKVSNGLNWQMVLHDVTVEDAITGLLLNISKPSVCTEKNITFIPTISKGTNVSFVLTLKSNDWIHSQDISDGHYTSSTLPNGRHLVTVKALNRVSHAQVSARILVTKRIQGLQLVNCCSSALKAQKAIRFKAEIQNGFPVTYTWMFQLGKTGATWLTGQEVIFTPPDSGSLSVSVLATNGVCTETVNATLTVEWPVGKGSLICHSEKVFVGHAVTCAAKVNQGTNIRYLWDFGDSTEVLATDSGVVSHTFYLAGTYSVLVKVLNSVSYFFFQLHVKVEELQCSRPQASLVQMQPTIFRSKPNFFEARVDVNCSAYKTTYLWEIFRDSSCSNSTKDLYESKVNHRSLEDAASPFLFLPMHTLDVGSYCLVFTVSFDGTPLYFQQKTNVIVVHSPLVAVIKGGSHRVWPSFTDLILDGSESMDPDRESGMEDMLQYHWTCTTVNSTESPLLKQPIGSINREISIPSSHLQRGAVYTFTLTVHKTGRTPISVNQKVTVSEAPAVLVTVQSSTQHISDTVALVGRCAQCDHHTQYNWRAEDQSGLSLDLNEVTTSTGRSSPNLVMRSGVLRSGQRYLFALDVFQPSSGAWGSASVILRSNAPPHGGLCELSPESGIRLLETEVTYNCSGWYDDESTASQLIYTFQVALCQPISSVCPLLTLYRGTRSTFTCLVPMGRPQNQQNMSVITIILVVEDQRGTKATALNRTLKVEVRDGVAIHSLRNKIRTELWTLVQHGNPQEIIPYSVALISTLNQMEFGWAAEELADRREIRENVTRALTSLPVSSTLHVDQISSALAQSTAVPSEMMHVKCQEAVLGAVGKMIHMIEEQTSLEVLDTGRNVLNIIGADQLLSPACNTLAAVSESVTSHSAYPGTLQAALSVVLSALDQAGALMRALMRSRVHDKDLLSMPTSYIDAVGYCGDPSELLCLSNHSSRRHMPCHFHIPASLSAHLKSQWSEVVQVLVGTNGAWDYNPLLAAADPPISTALVAMALTTPKGQPIPIRDLEPGRAIGVTLPSKFLAEQVNGRSVDNGTCLTVTLPTEGQLNFVVKDIKELDRNAGLYISFNFSLAPGAASLSLGQVKIEVSSASPKAADASQDSLVRQRALTLSALTSSSEETIFLSPLLNGTSEPLSVNLSSSGLQGGPVLVSVFVFSSLCRYYDVKEKRWSSVGLRPLESSTLRAAHCLTEHLTLFGASLFVHPGAVILLPPSGGPVHNTVVGIMCVVLVLMHLLVGLIAYKLDHLDSLRQSRVPLCGQSGLYHYRVLVKTGWRPGAGTTAHVCISLYGVNKSGSRHLQRDGAFQRGGLDQFHIETNDNLGEVWKIRIWHDNTGLDPSWYIQHVVVWDAQMDNMFFFLLHDWLSVENEKNGTVEKEVLASCPEELTQFGRVLVSQLTFGMVEGHLWLSLLERPVHSCFSRAQRVTCCALTLHLYLALGALWYGAVGAEGHREPVSAHLLENMEVVAVGMTVALLAFPLQSFICFLFRKVGHQVNVDMTVPSPVCQSVEMDVYLGQLDLSGPSLLSLPESSDRRQAGASPLSLLESKALDSSIMDFWAASGLAPHRDAAYQGEGRATWPSCDSLLDLPAGSCPIEATSALSPRGASPVGGPARQLKRKKAMMQVHLAPAKPEDAYMSPVQVDGHNLTTVLTLSEEDLLMSIEASSEDTGGVANNNSDSGRDSPRTTPSFSATCRSSCSSWSEQSVDKCECGAKPDHHSCTSAYGRGLHKCPSVLSADSVASTFLPSPSPDSTRSSPTTRIGVSRGRPSQLLPPWTLCVIHPVIALLLAASLAAVGLYGSSFSRTVTLMWILSTSSAFLTSAFLLEPLKVCVQALICTALWRPVDPEVEERLAQETTVVRALAEPSGRVRPPCGYGLLQAKEEARRVRALRSLMMHCVLQLLFLLLVLMVNYQDRVEQAQGRLLSSSIRRHLHTAPPGLPNLASLKDWSDAERWINHTLLAHLHQNPSLRAVGLPRLQYTDGLGHMAAVLLGNNTMTTRHVLADLHIADKSKAQLESLSIDCTHYHRESALFVCASIRLKVHAGGLAHFLSLQPLLILSPSSGLGLQVALTILLLLSALLMLCGELWFAVTERAQYLGQCHHWFQLLLAFLSLMTSILQLCFLSSATMCVSQLRSHPDNFISFHSAALLAQTCSQFAAVLLTLLILKLLGTLRFVRRWVVIGRVLWGAWRELLALGVLALLLLLLCTHLGNTLFFRSVEGFLSVRQASTSVLSILQGQTVLSRLCKAHPVLGPLYGLLLMCGCVWLLARLCGAVLLHAYRVEQAEMFRPAIEHQDYEMVEFFFKRLKLWMGLTKAKQFRHRVKFEGMDIPPSRISQESRLSILSSNLPPSHSPSLTSSISAHHLVSLDLSLRSEDSSESEPGFEVQPYLDSLVPCVTALLSHFDRVNQLTEDVHSLEMKLEEVQARRRQCKDLGKPEMVDVGLMGHVRHRMGPSSFNSSAASGCPFPRTRNSHSESESVQVQTRQSSDGRCSPGICTLYADSPKSDKFPRRRPWHSGSSHSADATQRALQLPGLSPRGNGGETVALPHGRPRSEEWVRGWCIHDGVPVKRKAWISEGPEFEKD